MLAEPLSQVLKVLLRVNRFLHVQRALNAFLGLKSHEDGAWIDQLVELLLFYSVDLLLDRQSSLLVF